MSAQLCQATAIHALSRRGYARLAAGYHPHWFQLAAIVRTSRLRGSPRIEPLLAIGSLRCGASKTLASFCMLVTRSQPEDRAGTLGIIAGFGTTQIASGRRANPA